MKQAENRARNIALAGFPHDRNLGEQAIYAATKYAVQRILARARVDANLIELNLAGGGCSSAQGSASSLLQRCRRKLRRAVCRHCLGKGDLRCGELELACRRKLRYGVDAIIFTGGGLINYRHSTDFGRLIDIVLRLADRRGIPVMFSGLGIEEYDPVLSRCQQFKQCLNRDCVKYISTRDDIETLRNAYLDGGRSGVRTMRVSDSACSLKDVYPAAQRQTGVVGLGVLRENLFEEYDRSTSSGELLALYADIYRELTARGKKCRLFSNGTLRDQRFAERVAESLQLDVSDPDVLAPRPERVEELVGIITSCEAVIATRLHASIIAYSYGVPFVGLVWNDKQLFFGEAIGRPERFFEEKDFDAKRIVDRALEAVERQDVDRENDSLEYRKSNERALEAFLREHVIGKRLTPPSTVPGGGARMNTSIGNALGKGFMARNAGK